MKKPIRLQYSKSTRVYTHIDREEKKTEITGLPPQASLKAVITRVKAMGLRVK